jgi:hypothetical protein
MDGFRRVLIAVVVAASLVAIGRALHHPRATGVSPVVPAYFYPGNSNLAAWEQLARAASRIRLRVILNPSSGPGKEVDPNYTAVLRKLRKAECQILGYVHTSYGAREIGKVTSEIEAYLTLYGVDGYFLDEMSTDPGMAGYYAKLRDHIKLRDRRLEIVGNPGTITTEPYVSGKIADVVVLFEGPATAVALYSPPAWVRHYPRSRFAAIIYDNSTAEGMQRLLDRCIQTRTGSVFISDGKGTNPYDRLPAYWEQQVNELSKFVEPIPEDAKPTSTE